MADYTVDIALLEGVGGVQSPTSNSATKEEKFTGNALNFSTFIQESALCVKENINLLEGVHDLAKEIDIDLLESQEIQEISFKENPLEQSFSFIEKNQQIFKSNEEPIEEADFVSQSPKNPVHKPALIMEKNPIFKSNEESIEEAGFVVQRPKNAVHDPELIMEKNPNIFQNMKGVIQQSESESKDPKGPTVSLQTPKEKTKEEKIDKSPKTKKIVETDIKKSVDLLPQQNNLFESFEYDFHQEIKAVTPKFLKVEQDNTPVVLEDNSLEVPQEIFDRPVLDFNHQEQRTPINFFQNSKIFMQENRPIDEGIKIPTSIPVVDSHRETINSVSDIFMISQKKSLKSPKIEKQQIIENVISEISKESDLDFPNLSTNFTDEKFFNQPIQGFQTSEKILEKEITFISDHPSLDNINTVPLQNKQQNISLMDMLSEKIQKPIYIKNLDIGSVEKNRQEFTPSVLSTSMLQVLQEDHESNNITFGDMLDAKGPQQAYIPNTLLSQSQEIEDINFQGPKIEIPQIQNMVLTRKNTDVIEIQLYPESLGKVDVKVSMQQSTGNMEAVFAPETVEGYQAVLKEQHKLTDSLLTLLHKETKKEGSSAAIIEIRITEPKSLDSAFSSTDKNFFGASTSSFNSQDGHKGQSFSEKAYSFASKIYSESQIIEQDKILDNNRRLDLAI